MDFKRGLGYGVLLYGVAFLFASLFMAAGLLGTVIAKLVVPLAVGLAAYLFARKLHVSDTKSMLMYSFSWLLIVAFLDLVITAPFSGFEIFLQWNVWLGYVFILVNPLLAVQN